MPSECFAGGNVGRWVGSRLQRTEAEWKSWDSSPKLRVYESTVVWEVASFPADAAWCSG